MVFSFELSKSYPSLSKNRNFVSIKLTHRYKHTQFVAHFTVDKSDFLSKILKSDLLMLQQQDVGKVYGFPLVKGTRSAIHDLYP